MANSDYIAKTGNFGFCPTAKLVGAIGHLDTAAVMTGFSASFANALRVGMAAMIDDEIVSITAATGNNLTLGRGCCDTIPAAHAANSIIWFFDDSIGSVDTEYTGSETVSVKMLPRTSGGGAIPIEHSPPKQIGFNFRFARPYPPGRFKINGIPWFNVLRLEAATEILLFTWVDRNRITQMDQLIDHEALNITPEAGTTYRFSLYNSAGGFIKTVDIPSGTQFWSYSRIQATTDLGVVGGIASGYFIFSAVRDTLLCFQQYRIDFEYSSTPTTFDSVHLLLRMNGENGSQVLIDGSGYGNHPTVVGAGALTTASKKYGSASWKGVANSYFMTAIGSAGLITGDFTLQFWTMNTGIGEVVFYSTLGGGYLYNGSFQGYGGPSLTLDYSATSGAFVHMVICRQGSAMRSYKGGVQQATVTYSGTVDLRTLRWGMYVPNNNLHYQGWLDDIRLRIGVCEYPNGTTFTPPTAELPDS